MTTIGKAVAVWCFAALVAATGAWAGDVPMEGAYGKLSWTTWVGKKAYSGYLFVTSQPDSTTYLYYNVQSGNEPPVNGYGLIPNAALTRGKEGQLELALDASQLPRGFFTSGTAAAGRVNVTWEPKGSLLTVHAGASGTQIGRVREVTQGTWTSGAAVARGDVLAWPIGDDQSAEMGEAYSASNQIASGR